MSEKWKFAPPWANFCAQNADGDWWWFENKPSFKVGQWNAEGRQIRRYVAPTSLEERPK